MTEFLFEEFDKEFALAREAVRQACDNPEYLIYASEQGPLLLNDIETVTPEIERTVEEFGWPDELDGVIRPPQIWASDEAFMRSLDQNHRHDIGMSTILHTLGSKPIRNYGDAERGIDVNGMNPYLHRAHALAPDLMEGVRVIVNTMSERYRHFTEPGSRDFFAQLGRVASGEDVDLGDDNLLKAYLQPENRDLCQAIHMAYKIMSRLLKVDDPSRRPGGGMGKKYLLTDAHNAMMGQWE